VQCLPQGHPLWLAEIRDGEVYAGRVVGWHVADVIDGLPGSPTATPIVAFTTPDGLLLETGTPHGALMFLADTREEAVDAAHRLTGPTAGFGPLPADEEDDDADPPDTRTRVHNPRRPTVADLTDPAAPDADPVARRTTRPDRNAAR
jgi:hypothetical protein